MDIASILQKAGIPFEIIALISLVLLAIKLSSSIKKFMNDQKSELNTFKTEVTTRLLEHEKVLNQLIGRDTLAQQLFELLRK